ncbi:hypothetical protein QE152_g8815 [Popillia japonica]|uniref:Uncharacterized protein n=1 Tax=Popillia japonica TaxID=7064 RepID=A0AAW1M4T3_POPJA
MEQTFEEPTRVTKASYTLIDNIFITTTADYATKIVPTAPSDHLRQVKAFDASSGNSNTSHQYKYYQERRLFTDKNLQLMEQELSTTDWSLCLESSDINVSYNYHHHRVMDVFSPRRGSQ